MRHDNTAYQSGCRCGTCRAAHTLYMNRYRQRREANGGKTTERGIRGGHLFQPCDLVSAQIVDLRARLTVRRIAAECGISTRTVRELQLRLRDRVHPRVASQVQALWDDTCGACEPLGRLPVAPLRAAAVRRFPPPDGPHDQRVGLAHILSEAERRALYRSQTFDVGRAEELCRKLGFYPEDVWGPDWLAPEAVAS